MRVSHRLALTCLLLWALLGRDCAAQLPPGSSGYAAPRPSPASMAPYPANSLYDFEFQQHYHQDGMWHRIAEAGGRRMIFNLDYLFARTRRPEGYVGQRGAMTYKDLILPILEEDPYDLGSGGGGGGSNQQSVIDLFAGDAAAGIPGFNYYDPVSFSGALESLKGPGARIQWGYIDSDKSGLIVEGFGHHLERHYDARSQIAGGRGGNKDLVLQLLSPPDFLLNDIGTADPDLILQNNLLNLRGLPLDDGSSFGLSSPFDLEFQLTAKSKTYGATINWLMTPSYRKGTFMVRPVFGVRYLRVVESFHFYGQDSGLSYDNLEDLDEPFNGDVKVHSPPDLIDNDRDLITDPAGLMEDPTQGQGGGGGGGAADDEFRFIIYNDPTMYPMTSYLNNFSRSDLVGPEIGLRYDLGGKKFKFWGQTKVGVMANTERLRMNGDNIGMVTRQNNFNLPTPDDSRPNRFTDRESHSHVSPVFEQSLFVEFPIFHRIPVLKRLKILRNAHFRFGWTYLYVGNLARPYESIRWRGHPVEGLYPSIDVDRSRWWAQNFSYSINWRY